MTKINVEKYTKPNYKIPVQRLGGAALAGDPKEKRRLNYGRRSKAQDHGVAASQRQKDRMPDSLANQRAKVFDQVSKLSPEELELQATLILNENGIDQNGQKLDRVGNWNSEDYDAAEELAQQLATAATMELMGAQIDLDEQIRGARHGLRKQRENSALEKPSDDDPIDYTLDGLSNRKERENQ